MKRLLLKRNILFLVVILVILAIVLYIKIQKTENQIVSPQTSDEWGEYLFSKTVKYCTRKDPYKLDPVFERSLSLIFERLGITERMDSKAEGSFSQILLFAYVNKNCLDIKYANSIDEMSGADGLFFFSDSYSGPDRLKILVAPFFKAESDLLTALLLSHELRHVEQFIEEDVFNKTLVTCNNISNRNNCKILDENFGYLQKSCYKKEVEAFLTEIRFFSFLNGGEIQMLASSYVYLKKWGYDYPVIEYVGLMDSVQNCVSYSNPWKCIEERLTTYVNSSPFYIKQCGG